MSSLANWLRGGDAQDLDIEALLPTVLSSPSQGSAAWLEALATSVTEKGASNPEASSVRRLALLAAHASPSQLERHLSRLLPALVALAAAPRGGSCKRGAALSALSALFGRFDAVGAEARGNLCACLGKLIPAACAACHGDDDDAKGERAL